MNPLPVFLYVDRNQLMIEPTTLEPPLSTVRVQLPPKLPETDMVQVGPLVIDARGRFKGIVNVDKDGNGHLVIASIERIPDWVPGMEWVVP